MKFKDFLETKQTANIEEIETIFQQADRDIKALFDQLVKGTRSLVGRQQFGGDEQLRRSIMQDLQNIAKKIRAPKAAPTDVGAATSAPAPAHQTTFRDPVQDSVMINTYMKSIVECINEAETAAASSPSIVAGLGSHAKGAGGKPVYDFQSAITNIHRQVMERMAQLKDAVFKHLGIWQKRIGGIQQSTGAIRNQVGDIHSTLANPPQPFNSEESERAEDSMAALMPIATMSRIKLVSRDGTEIPVNPRDQRWQSQVMHAGLVDKRFKIIMTVGNKNASVDVNMGRPADVHRAIQTMQGQLGIDTRAPEITPVSGNKLRARKLAPDKPETTK